MDLSFLTKKCVGLDIGSKNIKLVYLTPKGQKQFKLVYLKKTSLPDNVVPPDTLTETRNPVVIESIKSIYSEKKSLPRNVSISVSGVSVVIRYVKLPLMTKEELEKSISIEVEPFVPFPINEVYLSFDIIGEVLDEGVRKNEIVVAAAKKDFIDSQINILYQCKLVPKYIDVDIFALEKVLRYNYEIENDVVFLVNIGANITNVGIIENGITRICRDLPLGMSYVINEIKKNRSFETDTVIDYLKNDGLILTDEEKETYIAENKKTELGISKDTLSVLKEFTTELHKIVDFYYFQKGEQKPITKIFLSGGGCIIKNLPLYFKNEFNVETEVLDPFRKIEGAENLPYEEKPLFAVSVGLAMKSYL